VTTALRQIQYNEPLFSSMRDELASAELPTDNLLEGDSRYFALGDDGFGGLVDFGEVVLLRSIVVSQARRNRGTGGAILSGLLAEARAMGAREAWLLTTTAESFFEKHGFLRTVREGAPKSITDTSQFQTLCPASAALMCRRL